MAEPGWEDIFNEEQERRDMERSRELLAERQERAFLEQDASAFDAAVAAENDAAYQRMAGVVGDIGAAEEPVSPELIDRGEGRAMIGTDLQDRPTVIGGRRGGAFVPPTDDIPVSPEEREAMADDALAIIDADTRPEEVPAPTPAAGTPTPAGAPASSRGVSYSMSESIKPGPKGLRTHYGETPEETQLRENEMRARGEQYRGIGETREGIRATIDEQLRVKRAGDAAYAQKLEENRKIELESQEKAKEEWGQIMKRVEDHRKMKVDDDFYGRSTTGGKIGMIVSAMMGGWLAPLQGGRNNALSFIERAIERDIRNQEMAIKKVGREIDMDRSMFEDSQRMTKNRLERNNLHALRMYQAVGREIDTLKLQASGIKEIGKLNDLQAQIKVKATERASQLYNIREKRVFRNKVAEANQRHQRSMEVMARARTRAARDAANAQRMRAKLKAQEMAEANSVSLPAIDGTNKLVKVGDLKAGIGSSEKKDFKERTRLRANFAHQMTRLREEADRVNLINAKGLRTKKEKEVMSRYTSLMATYIKSISGAAVSDQEREFLKQALVAPKSWKDFMEGSNQGAWDAFTENQAMAQRTDNAVYLTSRSANQFDVEGYFFRPPPAPLKETVSSYEPMNKAIMSGNPDELRKQADSLTDETIKSVIHGKPEYKGVHAADVETTLKSLKKGYEKIDGKMSSFAPPKGPKPSKSEVQKLNAWKMKREKAIAARNGRARLAGKYYGNKVAYGVRPNEEDFNIYNSEQDDWMTKPERKKMVAIFNEEAKRVQGKVGKARKVVEKKRQAAEARRSDPDRGARGFAGGGYGGR